MDKSIKKKKYCSVFNCLNTNLNQNLSFFSLPSNTERCRKWLTLMDRPDLLEKKELKNQSYNVCSIHFEDSAIRTIRHLKDNALPTIFLPNQPQESTGKTGDNEHGNMIKTTSAKSKPPPPRQQNDPFVEYVNDSTDEELFDTNQKTSKSTTVATQEKVFLNSLDFEEDESDEEPLLKKSRIKAEDFISEETEQFYEFGKFVAEQLMCLDVEDALKAKEQIKTMLTNLMRDKTKRCLETPSACKRKQARPFTSKLSATSTQLDSVKSSVVVTAKKTQATMIRRKNNEQATQSSSNVTILTPSVNPPLMVNVPKVSIPIFSMNIEPTSVYIAVPKTNDNLTRQLGNTEGTLPGSETSEMNRETLPATQLNAHEINTDTDDSSEAGSSAVQHIESIQIKIDPCSDDET